jgi:hypothetical protein
VELQSIMGLRAALFNTNLQSQSLNTICISNGERSPFSPVDILSFSSLVFKIQTKLHLLKKILLHSNAGISSQILFNIIGNLGVKN